MTSPVQSNPTLIIYPPAKVWTRWKNQPSIIKLNHWLYDHPKIRKAAAIAADSLGFSSLAAAAFVPPISASIGLAAVGISIIGVTYLAARVLDCLVPIRHDMKNFAFQPDKLEKHGKLLGKLYYDGAVPILKINASDPKEAGYTQGYLLQKAISALRSNAEFCIFTLARQKRPSQLASVLNEIKSKIPKRFLLELEGMVEGYNAKKGTFDKALSFDDLLYLQLMPDAMYLHPNNFKVPENQSKPRLNKAQSTPMQAVACTLLAMPDNEGAPLMARTMDWKSFGIAGKFSLIISRFHENTKTRTAEVGIPGLVGSLTGVNSKGLSIAMNVTSYTGNLNTIEGIPSSLYNRMILEECSSFKEAEQFIGSHQALGPYHLTVSDPAASGTFSLYQKENWTNLWHTDKLNGHRLRLLDKENPLVTTNCSCTPNRHDMFNGKVREELIKEYLIKNQEVNSPRQLLENSQSIPWVNNHLTTHRVLMGHKTLKVAFDNAWAGDRSLHSVNLTKLFS